MTSVEFAYYNRSMNQAGQDSPQASTVQTSTAKSSPKSPLKLIIIVVLLGILVGGAYTVYTFLQPRPSTQKPASGTPVPRTDQNNTSTPHYVGSQTITLSDAGGGSNSGTATREVTSTSISFSITANLPEPFVGQNYQAWVIDVNENVFSLGTLTSNQDGTHSLTANNESEFDPAASFSFSELGNNLLVTLESEDGNRVVNALEGTFTE